ncbi:hypothetical protein D3C72_1230220 [compost metagenome]
MVDGAHKQAVTVGRLLGGHFGAHDPAAACAVVNKGGLPPQLPQRHGKSPRRGIHRPTGRERHDEFHLLAGVIRRVRRLPGQRSS